VIVLAVLNFVQPTILGPSWVPWVRAVCTITVLAVAIVAVILAV
jgi:hypothetical protein